MPVRCPFAQWRPLETAQREPAMRSHDVAGLHTMAGFLTSTDGLFRSGGWDGTESHFGVGGRWGPDLGGHLDGALFQWQDLLHQADANLDGNPRVISIETADNATSPIQPWTPAQIETLVRLLDWLCSREAHASCPPSWLCHQIGIPRVLVPDSCPNRRGIAYHRLGVPASSPNRRDGPWLKAGCERWSNATGKVCPGDARIAQIRSVIVPRVAARQLEDAVSAEDVQAALDAVARRVPGIVSFERYLEVLLAAARQAAGDDTDEAAIAAAVRLGLAEEVAERVHAKLPAGALTRDDVAGAVREVFADAGTV